MSLMRANDARKLDRGTQESLRMRAVAAVQGGQSPEVVAKVFGVNRDSIYGWLAKYRQGGWSALKRRAAPGRKPKLDAAAMRWIYRVVVDKTRRCLIRSATPPESGGKSLVWGFVAEALSRSSIDLCGDAVKI